MEHSRQELETRHGRLRARLQENQTVLQSKGKDMYQTFITNRAARMYKEITKESVVSPTTNMKNLDTAEA